jgi:membrane associated rhomboid family serine protease
MFPIKDTVRSRSFPIINWAIIIVNGLIFLYEYSLSNAGLEHLLQVWALVPASIQLSNPLTWYRFFTHIWLHASWFHVITNMWFLAIFGDNVEDRLGSGRYLLFYVLGGIAAGVLQYIFSSGETIPALGASGAIAAVMGAYLVFYPRAKVVTFVPILLFIWFVNIPAVFFLLLWFFIQLISGFGSLGIAGSMGGVAWFAHVGGFLFGMIMARPFCIGRCHRGDYPDEYYPW